MNQSIKRQTTKHIRLPNCNWRELGNLTNSSHVRFEKYNFPTSSPHITYKVKVCVQNTCGFYKQLRVQGFDLQELGMDNLVRILKDRVEVLTR